MNAKKRELNPEEQQECQRLKALYVLRRKDYGLTQEAVAAQLGISQAAVSHYLNGVNALNLDTAVGFATLLSVEVDEFSERLARQRRQLASENPAGAGIRTYRHRDELSLDDYVWIDRYDVKLSAGNGNAVWAIREKDPISFRSGWFKQKGLNPEACKAMYVRGRSMEPKLDDYDSVLIDTADTDPIDGEIYAFVYRGHFYIKTFQRTSAGVRLKSENPEFESIDIADDNIEQLRVLGKKVWRGG
jgi:phage repressor protein C with HTH and peptisase S24 domain